MISTKDKNFVNIVHDTSNTRIYYDNGEFFAFTVTRDDIISESHKKVVLMSKHVEKMIGDCQCYNLLFGYAKGSISKKREKKALAYERTLEQDISKYISLLLP